MTSLQSRNKAHWFDNEVIVPTEAAARAEGLPYPSWYVPTSYGPTGLGGLQDWIRTGIYLDEEPTAEELVVHRAANRIDIRHFAEQNGVTIPPPDDDT